jgi:hydroxymethylbilane synthase
MLTIGSRGSQLALWQANWVKQRLEELGQTCRIETIVTTGDKLAETPLGETGSKGVFIKEIEEALLDGQIDLAVHSLKDMPTGLPDGLTIAAIPQRAEARDALVGPYKWRDLPRYARVGTSSPRRTAQLKAARPDLKIEPVRGNVDTRLRKLDAEQFDALVLAAAGLIRLGLEARIAELLSPEIMVPAVGQGALVIETRADGGAGFTAARKLNHNRSAICAAAERTVLASLGGGCQVPIGVYARMDNLLHIEGIVISPDGAKSVRRKTSGDPRRPEVIGDRLAKTLLQFGGREILDQAGRR